MDVNTIVYHILELVADVLQSASDAVLLKLSGLLLRLNEWRHSLCLLNPCL